MMKCKCEACGGKEECQFITHFVEEDGMKVCQQLSFEALLIIL